jgi:hypothetical protein
MGYISCLEDRTTTDSRRTAECGEEETINKRVCKTSRKEAGIGSAGGGGGEGEWPDPIHASIPAKVAGLLADRKQTHSKPSSSYRKRGGSKSRSLKNQLEEEKLSRFGLKTL